MEVNAGSNPLSKLVFRCYKPMDEELGKTAKIELQTQSPWAGWLEQIKQEDALLASQPIEEKATLVPNKPNWDLKRDAAKKSERLERETQRAIANIIRAKLQTQQQQQSVPAGSAALSAAAGASAQASQPSTIVSASLDSRAEGIDSATLSRALAGMARAGAQQGQREELDEEEEQGEEGDGGRMEGEGTVRGAAGRQGSSKEGGGRSRPGRWDSDDEEG